MVEGSGVVYVVSIALLSNHSPSLERYQGPVSRKYRKLFGPEKPFVKLQPAYSAKLVFSYVVKGIKIKITAKFRASRCLTFEDTKRIMSPKKFRDFRETGPRSLNIVDVFSQTQHSVQAQKPISTGQGQIHKEG